MRTTARTAAVTERVKRIIEQLPKQETVEGVMPLNEGFFLIERVRMESRPKPRDEQRQPLQDKVRG